MSNSNPKKAKATLVVDAGEQQTEIEILDGDLNPISLSDNLGRVEVELDPGVYAVRFRTGNQVKQKLAVLKDTGARETVSLGEDELMFPTAAPISKTTTSRETHQAPAERISRTDPLAIDVPGAGAGESHLLVFARDPDAEQPFNPAEHLSLHCIDGTFLIDLPHFCEYSADQHWAGCHLKLPPGGYLLRNSRESGRWEEFLVQTCQDWQTQLFLRAKAYGREGEIRRIDLSGASVLMAPFGRGFDPGRPDNRWTEQALLALNGGRAVPGTVRTDMLWQKFENPMLGIYAAHLHLGLKKINPHLMKEVFFNLLDLVGPIPDVLAIGWGLVLKAPEEPGVEQARQVLHEAGAIEIPPMLKASWRWLVSASIINKDLIPASSAAGRTSGTQMLAGPWLVQTKTEEEVQHQPKKTLGLAGKLLQLFTRLDPSEALDNISQKGLGYVMPLLVKFFKSFPEDASYIYSRRYSDLERHVALYLYPMADRVLETIVNKMPNLKERIMKESVERSKNPAGFIEALHIPASTALKTVASLVWKLKVAPVLPRRNRLERFVDEESQQNDVLKVILKGLEKHPTGFYHPPSGQTVNRQQFLYLRYRNSPAAGSKTPTASELANTLNENDFVHQPAAGPISNKVIAKLLGELRKDIAAELKKAIQEKKLDVPDKWVHGVLPPPNRYNKGQLFPALVDKNELK